MKDYCRFGWYKFYHSSKMDFYKLLLRILIYWFWSIKITHGLVVHCGYRGSWNKGVWTTLILIKLTKLLLWLTTKNGNLFIPKTIFTLIRILVFQYGIPRIAMRTVSWGVPIQPVRFITYFYFNANDSTYFKIEFGFNFN